MNVLTGEGDGTLSVLTEALRDILKNECSYIETDAITLKLKHYKIKKYVSN